MSSHAYISVDLTNEKGVPSMRMKYEGVGLVKFIYLSVYESCLLVLNVLISIRDPSCLSI